MYDRCISVCSSTGSTRPPGSGVVVVMSSVIDHFRETGASGDGCGCSSDVEEANVLGVSLDEGAALLDVFAHQDGEDLVRVRGVVERHLGQDAVVGVHGRLPELVGVHLSE